MHKSVLPHGGELVDLVVDENAAERLKGEPGNHHSYTLTQRQLCDLELLMSGAFSPLKGFMCRDDYESVVSSERLADGTLWPVPICLDVSEEIAKTVGPGDRIGLLDQEGFMLAVMRVDSVWQYDKNREAENVYGTSDRAHPGVDRLFSDAGDWYVGGDVKGVQLPFHYDFLTLRDTPAGLRDYFSRLGWRNVVAFHTSKPMHKVQREVVMRAARKSDAHILIHPVVGMSKPGDIHYHARVHCYQKALQHFPKGLVCLSLLPAALRMAGPREALLNAIIRQNYGVSHYIVGPEHASPPNVRDGEKRFYERGAAQRYVMQYADELDIEVVSTPELVFDEQTRVFVESSSDDEHHVQVYSNRRIVQCIEHDDPLPSWVTWDDVAKQIRSACPPRRLSGMTLFFTGLSGSGKSTLANILYAKFIEEGDRPVTLLDGDIVRLNLSSELGFSRKDRNINVNRIGFVASEITKNKGIAICAPIAPYTEMRRQVRSRVEEYGAFIEIHVATPLEVCESRDRKGLYAKARKGIIPEFTGISDPYEEPENPELCINTDGVSPLEAVQEIYLYLISEGYISAELP